MVHKDELGTDARGNYRRRLGKRQDGQTHTFYLGTDKREALRRNAILEGLWARCSPVWTETDLLAAKQIAAGETQITVPEPDDVKGWLRRDIKRMQEEEIMALGLAVKGKGELHAALKNYQNHLKAKNQGVDRRLTEWGVKLVETIQRFIDHHADMPLSALNLEKCEELLRYWSNRPNRKGTKQPIAASTARNQRIQLMAFFKWLGRQQEHGWQRPAALSDFRCKIPLTDEEKGRRSQRLPTFTVEELEILFRHATPRVRLFMLLALNCAFKQAEIGGLLKREVHLGQVHPHYKGQKTNYLFRTRRKSGVYGEWKLWTETAVGLAQAMNASKSSHAIATETGGDYAELTAGGNHNQKINSLWKNLIRTVRREEEAAFRNLPFTALVDTAVDMVREVAGGEVAGIFKCHGKPVSDGLIDLYSGRPFDKVFDALDQVHQRLRPALTALAGGAPRAVSL